MNEATRQFNGTMDAALRRAGDAMSEARSAILAHAEACTTFDWPMAEAASLLATAKMEVYFDALQAAHRLMQAARRGPG